MSVNDEIEEEKSKIIWIKGKFQKYCFECGHNIGEATEFRDYCELMESPYKGHKKPRCKEFRCPEGHQYCCLFCKKSCDCQKDCIEDLIGEDKTMIEYSIDCIKEYTYDELFKEVHKEILP